MITLNPFPTKQPTLRLIGNLRTQGVNNKFTNSVKTPQLIIGAEIIQPRQ